MLKTIIEYIKYSWKKDTKDPGFNIFAYIFKVLNFIKYNNSRNKPNSRNGFTTFIVFIMLVLVVRSCFDSNDENNLKPTETNKTIASEEQNKVNNEVKLKQESLLKDFVKKNENSLGTLKSFNLTQEQNNLYTFSTSNFGYNLILDLSENKINSLSVSFSETSMPVDLNEDGTINKKSLNHSISEIKKSIELDKQIAKQEKIKETFQLQFSAWDGSHIKLVRTVKDSMNDPKSFEHVETRYYFDKKNNEIIHVIMKFRGTNAFGALILNTIKAKIDIDGNVLDYVVE